MGLNLMFGVTVSQTKCHVVARGMGKSRLNQRMA